MTTRLRRRAFTAISLLSASATLATLTLLGGCASAPTTPATPAVAAALTVTAEQSGAAIELSVGQELVVRLATTATSGEEWRLIDLAPGAFSVKGPSFEREARNASVEEAGGDSVWRLRAARTGTAVLNFEYRRPRDLAPATRRAAYTVTVR